MKKLVLLLILFCLFPKAYCADRILEGLGNLSLESAKAGDTFILTVTLQDLGTPPLPPSGVVPTSVSIGPISGSSIYRTDLVITATFTVASDELIGSKDVSVIFTLPNGTLTIIKYSAFTVLPAGANLSVVYVNANSTAILPDGSSWETAYSDLQRGLILANIYSAELWVTSGVYKPTSTMKRTVAFELGAGVKLYGGFSGVETELSQRDFAENMTILSGDIGEENTDLDNSYHVVIGANSAIIDGFKITKGYANGTKLNRLGGGVYLSKASTEITNCIITQNYAESGGGIYSINISQTDYNPNQPVISSCTFSNNNAKYGGAILCRVASDIPLTNCVFENNSAEWRGGAIFIDYGADIQATGCSFFGNVTLGNGGAVYIDDRASQTGGTYPVFRTCSFTENSATYRGGAVSNYNENCNPTITNCSFVKNSAGTGGGAIANDFSVLLTVSSNTYSENSGGSGSDDVDSDSTSTVISQ